MTRLVICFLDYKWQIPANAVSSFNTVENIESHTNFETNYTNTIRTVKLVKTVSKVYP